MISTTRHLKYSYISIFTNLLRTDNEMKTVKPIYTIKRLLNRSKKIPCVQVKQKDAKS